MSKNQVAAALSKRKFVRDKNDREAIAFINAKEYWRNLSLKNIRGERWYDVPGYEGKYLVSNFARIKSLELKIWNGHHYVLSRERILKQQINHKGYLLVHLRTDGKGCTKLVHRIVGLVFHKNQNNKKQINHKKGRKKDNRPSQIEWSTNSENQQHAHRTGLKKGNIGEKHGRAILTEVQVLQIKRNYKGNTKGERKALVERYGISESAIKDILKGKNWKHVQI